MKRVAQNSEVETFLRKLTDLMETIQDDAIKSDLMVVIEDTCKDRDFCLTCLSHIDEAYIFDELVRTCHCGEIPQNNNGRIRITQIHNSKEDFSYENFKSKAS